MSAETATSAYMTSLPQATIDNAIAYTHGGHCLFFLRLAILALGALLIGRSGIIAKTRAYVIRHNPTPYLADFLCTTIALGLEWTISLPWMIYVQWKREIDFGMPRPPLLTWLSTRIVEDGAIIALIGCLAVPIYVLIHAWPRIWWLLLGLVIAICGLGALMIGQTIGWPVPAGLTPIATGDAYRIVTKLEQQAGMSLSQIRSTRLMSGEYTPSLSLNTWMILDRDIVIDRKLLERGQDLDVVISIAARQIGRKQLGQNITIVIVVSILLAISFYLISLLFLPLKSLVAMRDAEISEPSGLPIILLLVIIFSIAALPIRYRVNRGLDEASDQYALMLTRDPNSFARALLLEVGTTAPEPTPMEENFLYERSCVERRIHQGMIWEDEYLLGIHT